MRAPLLGLAKSIYYFSTAKHLIRRNQTEFLMAWSEERKTTFDQFQKAV